MLSRSDHGAVDKKKLFSACRACDHAIFALSSFELGCLTQNQLFLSGWRSLRMKCNQCASSPAGMRSGFVNTPTYIYEVEYI